MKAAAQHSGMTQQFNPLRDAFLRWQCRVRQISMRENFGRPDSAIKPALTLTGKSEPIGNIITVLSRTPSHSRTPEMRHMFQSIFDPSQRREKAIQFFSEMYYQKFRHFSDTLTAAFPPNSPAAEAIMAHWCAGNTSGRHSPCNNKSAVRTLGFPSTVEGIYGAAPALPSSVMMI